MNILKRRKYKAWLMTTLKKGELSRREADLILHGQLLLPARNRDAGLMKECAEVLTVDDVSASDLERRVWKMISQDIHQMEEQRKSVRKRTGLVLAMVLILVLAAAGLAAALSPQVFSFLWGQGTPNAYVQEDAAGLVKTGLGSIQKEHVDITILEAAYDGLELRVVYSVRDKSATRPYIPHMKDEGLLTDAAAKDNLSTICDWVVVNGRDVFLSDCGENPGEQNGELLFYFQALMAEQDVNPEGDFTVGLPLGKDFSGPRIKSVVPPELQFTLNASEAKKLVRTAIPAEVTADDVHLQMTEATFTPIAGSIRLDVTGEDPVKTRTEAYTWGMDARLYTTDGTAISQPPSSSFDHPNGINAPPSAIMMRIVPPETWPSEMILAIPGTDGKPDAVKRIVIKLKEE